MQAVLGSAYADPLAGIAFNRPVIDSAEMITPEDERIISAIIQEVKRQGGPVIGVVTLRSLEGESIEAVSIRIADAWKLGTAAGDNGVILTIAKDDRRMRIEVGQGLEGDLPDAYAKRIIDFQLNPHFKQGRYGEGIFAAITQIVKHTFPEFDLNSAPSDLQNRSNQVGEPHSFGIKDIIRFIIMILIMIFLIATPMGRLLLFSSLLSGGRSRRGGGFGSGGGFGGGGGGFSGGGASGGW